MAMTFLKQPTSFGQSFGEGVGSSLQRLAAGRLQQIETQNEQKDFARRMKAAYPNISDAEAAYVSGYPAEHRLKASESLPDYAAGVPQAEFAARQDQGEPTIFSAAQKQREAELAPEATELTQPDVNQLLKEHQFGQLAENLQIPKGNDLANFAKSLGYDVTPEKRKELQQKLDAFKNNPELLQQAKQQYDQKVANNETIEFRKPGYTAPAIPYEQAVQQLNTGRPTKKLTQAEKTAIQKEGRKGFEMSLKDRQEIHKGAEAASEAREHIKDLSELFKSGKLDTPGALSFLEEAGWPVEALQNPESAQAQNLIKSFLAQGPTLFGGKVSEGEMNVLLSAIPTLKTNPRGALLMLETMDKYAARAEAKEDALRDIMKENRNNVPLDYLEQIAERVKPKYNKINAQSKKRIREIGEIPLKEESFADTVLQTIYGKGIGAVGKGAKAGLQHGTAAAIGGAIGSVVPGVGTLAGAGVGGLGSLAADYLRR
jgi:hypothetical protein